MSDNYKPKTNETECTHICTTCDHYFSHYIIYTEHCGLVECEDCLAIQEKYPDLTSWVEKVIAKKIKKMLKNI